MANKFWFVKEGDVRAVAATEVGTVVAAVNWVDSVLAWAPTAEDALALAGAYDSGRIQPDNLTVVGFGTVAVLR